MRQTLLLLIAVLAFAAPASAATTREARGVLAATSSTSVTLRTDHGTLVCRLGEHSPSLAGFAAGDYAALVCAQTRDRWVLVRIRHLTSGSPSPAPAPHTTAPQSLGGAVAAVSSASITVRDGDHSLTCTTGSNSPNTADVRVGDHVRIGCASGVLTKLERLALPVYGSGTVVAVSTDGISVHGDTDVHCALGPASPSVVGVHVGDRVKFACAGGVLVQLARVDGPATSPPPPPPPSPTTTLYAAGAISALAPGSISVHGEHDVTCTVTDGSPHLGDFHVGDVVHIACRNGVLIGIARA